MLPRILPFLLFCIIATPIWIDFTYLRHLSGKKRMFYYVPHVLMLTATVLFTVYEEYDVESAWYKNIFIAVFLFLNFSETILALFLLPGHLLRKHKGLRNIFYALGALAAIGSMWVVAAGSFWGTHHLETVHQTISSPLIPESFDGYRIVQLSDWHLGTLHGDTTFAAKIVKEALSQKPDLIVFTGDLVSYNADELTPYLTILSRLKAPDGVLSILGNHDYMTHLPTPDSIKNNRIRLVKNELKMGWRPLLNRSKIIRRKDGDKIAVIGVENYGKHPFPQRADLKKAMKGLPEKCKEMPLYKILLSHDPYYWQKHVLPESDIQLTLSGHTHGGQIKIVDFPIISLFQKEWGGLYHDGSQKLFISTGLGEAFTAIRYGIWPQINVITLQRK